MTATLFSLLVHPAVVIRQRKSYRRKDGVFLYFEDNAGVIVNNKGEMKGKKVSTLFPRSLRWDDLTLGLSNLTCHHILFLCRFCYHWTCCKGVCRLVAQDCIQCWQHRMIICFICFKKEVKVMCSQCLPSCSLVPRYSS